MNRRAFLSMLVGAPIAALLLPKAKTSTVTFQGEMLSADGAKSLREVLDNLPARTLTFDELRGFIEVNPAARAFVDAKKVRFRKIISIGEGPWKA